MDLDFLFWLAILAIYILQAVASKKKQQQGGLPDASEIDQEDVPDDLQTALGEIGRILRGEPDPLPAPAPRPTPPPVQRPLPQRPLASTKLPKKSPAPFRGMETGKFYDDPFEKRGATTFKSPLITHDHQFDFQKAAQEPSAPVVTVPNLTSRQALRDAFVASEILGTPVSRRHRR
jgi:hypothetical protein